MDAGAPLEVAALLTAVARSGARALLIGRQALVALGLPVLTSDFDFWLHRADLELLNRAVAPLGLLANRSPDEALAHGRYVLENEVHVDLLVAAMVMTVDGVAVRFDELWVRRESLEVGPGALLALPALDDLILTKRFASRPRDAEDLRLLEALRRKREP